MPIAGPASAPVCARPPTVAARVCVFRDEAGAARAQCPRLGCGRGRALRRADENGDDHGCTQR